MEASNELTIDKISHNKYFQSTVEEIIRRHNQKQGYLRGDLFVTSILIQGSECTFEGIYRRKMHVAVKRVEKKTVQKDGESNEEEELDTWLYIMNQNTHVLPCYHIAEDITYYYFGVARCICNLEEFITDPIGIQRLYWERQGPGEGSHVISHLRSSNNKPTTKMNDMIRDITEGVAFIHLRGFTHTFLNCSHILISDEFRPVIGNYGKSIRTDKLAGWTAGRRNEGWRAPEVIWKKENITNTIDIFSLGCIFYYCIQRRHLYSSRHNETLSRLEENIKACKPSREQLSHLVKHCEAYDLVQDLTSSDPSLRLPAIEISKHPFFWSTAKSCNFIRETYEWLQLGGEAQYYLDCELERMAGDVFQGSWDGSIDCELFEAIALDNAYNTRRLVGLMRFFRNGIVHIANVLPRLEMTQLGNTPSSYFFYFSKRYPWLLTVIYKAVKKKCRYEEHFSQFFE